jgi:uncharacterized protein (DUF58 family)
MESAERYLRPEVIRQIKRLDLRAQFIVKGFLQGLHRSPFHGFSVEFSEHRKYVAGDDPKDLDWLIFAKTDKYYIKKYEAETNMTGFVVMDMSGSMDFRIPDGISVGDEKAKPVERLSKFEYSICTAAALVYLMIRQQDPVGLIAFDETIRHVLPAKSKRTQLAQLIGLLAKLKPQQRSHSAECLTQVASMLKHRSLVMVFSDLLMEDDDALLKSLRQMRHKGHDVILFHVIDAAEHAFPFRGMVELEEPETGERLVVDADFVRESYLEEKKRFTDWLAKECHKSRIDYVLLNTGDSFDRALIEYLLQRRHRF